MKHIQKQARIIKKKTQIINPLKKLYLRFSRPDFNVFYLCYRISFNFLYTMNRDLPDLKEILNKTRITAHLKYMTLRIRAKISYNQWANT